MHKKTTRESLAKDIIFKKQIFFLFFFATLNRFWNSRNFLQTDRCFFFCSKIDRMTVVFRWFPIDGTNPYASLNYHCHHDLQPQLLKSFFRHRNCHCCPMMVIVLMLLLPVDPPQIKKKREEKKIDQRVDLEKNVNIN